MRRFAVFSIIALVFSSAALCGDSKGKPPATPVSDDVFRLAAAEAVANAHLQLADMPAGWSSTPADPEDDDPPPGFEVDPECQILMVEEEFPGAIFEGESDEYDYDEDEDVSTSVGVYRTDAAADMGQGVFEHFFSSCTGEFVRLFKEYFAQEIPQATVDIDFERIDAPDLGDWSDAQRLEMTVRAEGITIEFTFESVTIREGRMLGTVSWGETENIDHDLTEEWLDVFAGRLAEADAGLPE